MARAAALIGVLAPLALSGCSLGGDQEPRPARGAVREVAQAVRTLERAIRRHDFRAVCDELFTAAARRHAGGKDCPRLVRSSAGDLRAPRIRLLKIQVRKDGRASATVRTTAAGQPSLEDTIELRRERGRYRIAALAG